MNVLFRNIKYISENHGVSYETSNLYVLYEALCTLSHLLPVCLDVHPLAHHQLLPLVGKPVQIHPTCTCIMKN